MPKLKGKIKNCGISSFSSIGERSLYAPDSIGLMYDRIQKLEVEQARLAAEQARLAAEQAHLDAEQARLAVEIDALKRRKAAIVV